MKKLFRYTIPVLLAASVGTACTGDFDEYNQNGENPGLGEVHPVTLLEDLISSSASDLQYRSWRLHSELMQYTVDCGNSTRFQLYIFPASEYDNIWKDFYMHASNAQEIVHLARKYEDRNMEAIGMTLKTLYISFLTDLYGDVPYSEALRIDEDLSQPKFDRQKDIYADLIRTLQEANTLYDTSKDNTDSYKLPLLVPEKDLLYRGDVALWQKFTNSLCMRLCLRLSNRDAETGALATLRDMVANPGVYPVFSSVADNAKIAFTAAAPFRGPFGGMTDGAFTASSHKCSKRFIDRLFSTSDPRRSRWVTFSGDTAEGVESGVKAPDGNGAAVMNVSVLKPYDAPAWFMTYSELLFILAEAAQQEYIPGGDALARQYYEDAVTASLQQWNPSISASDIDKFLHGAGSTVEYDGTLAQLMEQKWLSLFMQGFESWCDYRRTGLPALAIGPDVSNEYILPTRMLYSSASISNNSSNYEEQIGFMRRTYPVVSLSSAGGDNMKTPVWWSKRAVELEGGR